MKIETYEIQPSDKALTFEFLSKGKKDIVKVVKFDPVSGNIYNLSLGDYDSITKKADYGVKSKNGDTEKVIATVIEIIIKFLAIYPESVVYIIGDEEYKTRTYQLSINKFLDEFEDVFLIKGVFLNPLTLDFDEFIYERNKKFDGFIITNKPKS